MKNVIIRALSGIVYVALVLSCTWAGGYWFAALALLLGLGGMAELFRLAGNSTGTPRHPLIYSLDLLCGAILIISPCQPWLLPAALLYFPARMIAEIYSHDENPAAETGKSFLAICYVAVPVASLTAMRILIQPGFSLVLATFILIWISDTGAFCVGSLIGKRPLFPRISPKKSWEGFFGGVIFCIAAALVMKYCFASCFAEESAAFMITLGITVPVAATLGDLVESMLKRAAGVKDSGNIMPGHGGFLDRTDSLLAVSPIVLVLYLLFNMAGL